MKTILKNTPFGVYIKFQTVDGRVIEHTYRAKSPDSYVFDEHGKQPCRRLACHGSTLYAGANLLTTIRREYYAMRRAEKRDARI